MWTFEPHVAERLFNQMAQESGVPVFLEHPLARVEKNERRIVSIAAENGSIFRAKMFIDAS
jgi:hypothetical protein